MYHAAVHTPVYASLGRSLSTNRYSPLVSHEADARPSHPSAWQAASASARLPYGYRSAFFWAQLSPASFHGSGAPLKQSWCGRMWMRLSTGTSGGRGGFGGGGSVGGSGCGGLSCGLLGC